MPKMYIKNFNKEIEISSILSIFSSLYEKGITLINKCGGKGICGLCKIKILKQEEKFVSKNTEAELKHLTQDELKNGYRLACQTFTLKNLEIEIFGAKISNKTEE